MMGNHRQDTPFTMWGTQHSLYTGKVRAYLIKKRVAWREVYPSDPGYMIRIAPVVKSLVVPVLETSEGVVVQDTGDIIDYLEAHAGGPQLEPETPLQRTISQLLDAFGSEYMLPLAMHYRWSYRAEQENFLQAEFGRTFYRGSDRAAQREAGLNMMEYFNGFLPALGVTSDTIPVMEESYLELIDALDEHFQAHPYLLGGRPSRADFGFMAPFFAHLARDPVPAALMKNRAPNLYRWTERMNVPDIADGEFVDYPEDYAADDEVPATLERVLRCVFADWTPGLQADADCFNAWIAADPQRPAGQFVSIDGSRKIHPTLGPIEYSWRKIAMQRFSDPHGLWHTGKALDIARSLEGDARSRLDALLARTGGQQMMKIMLSRPMKHEDYVLVLA